MHLHGDQRLIRQTTVHVGTITGRDSSELWCHRDEVMDLAGAWWELFGRQHLEGGMMANGILERIADGRTDLVWAS